MIRLIGGISLLAAVALISCKVGWEAALYHGSTQQLAEAAKLRVMYWMRVWGVE